MTNYPTRQVRSFLVATAATKTYPFEGYSVEVELATNPTTLDTLVLGGTTYRFITSAVVQAYDVLIHATDATQTRNNLRHAINSSGVGVGSTYGTGTDPHPDARADLSLVADAIHLVSNTPLSLGGTANSGGDVLFKRWDLNVTAEMVVYAAGDWTHTASMSAAALLQGCVVTGITPYETVVSSAATEGFTFNHAGVTQQAIAVSYATQSPRGHTLPLALATGRGLAVELTLATPASYFHWEGVSRRSV